MKLFQSKAKKYMIKANSKNKSVSHIINSLYYDAWPIQINSSKVVFEFDDNSTIHVNTLDLKIVRIS